MYFPAANITWQQHVNNAAYIRYAEASRVNWIRYFANINPAHASDWRDLMNPRGVGLIMKSIKADYKFVSLFVYPPVPALSHSLLCVLPPHGALS